MLTHLVWETQGFFDEDFEINDQYLFIREFGKLLYLEITEPIFTPENELKLNVINVKVDIK